MDISGTSVTPDIRDNTTDFMQMLTSDPGFWINSAAGFTLFLFGLPLNTWALWLMVKDTGGLAASDMFALNLAAMEVCYCLFSPYIWFGYHFCSQPLLMFGSFFDGLIVAGQSMFQCCICVERYLAVVHPITYMKYKPVRYRVTCSGAVWLLASVFGGYSLYEFPSFPFYPFCVICFFLLVLSVFSSVAILKVLRQPGPGEGERERINLMKRRAFKIVFIILVMTVLSYFPFPTVGILYKEKKIPRKSIYLAYSISWSIFMSSSLIQPLYYLTSAGKLSCLQQCWRKTRQP